MISYLNKTLKEIASDIEHKYGKDVIYITDLNVNKYYSSELMGRKVILTIPGEDYKNFETVNYIYSKLLDFKVNKGTVLVGLGGGIVTDITGFVASTFMRGIKFGFISTTLLGMVDASIGGKNGINYNNYKNLIGNIREPSFIYLSSYFLKTLPQRELQAAYGEILKYAIGFDGNLFDTLEKNIHDFETIIKSCSLIKINIVSKDLYESGGSRRKLNLGHTIAHAIEKYTHKYVHGECVLIGLYIMNIISFLNNYITKYEYLRIQKLLKKYDTLSLDKKTYCNLILNSLDFIDLDKKGINDEKLDVVLINGIGKSIIVPFKYDELKSEIKKAIYLIDKK